jgi:hypothetical protein
VIQLPEVSPYLSSLLGIDLDDHLLEAHVNQLVTRDPGVLVRGQVDPLHLVLVAALQLAAAQDALHHTLGALNHKLLGHLLLLLLSDLAVHLLQGLTILTNGVAPLRQNHTGRNIRKDGDAKHGKEVQ